MMLSSPSNCPLVFHHNAGYCSVMEKAGRDRMNCWSTFCGLLVCLMLSFCVCLCHDMSVWMSVCLFVCLCLFLVACTRLYSSLCRSVGRSVGRSEITSLFSWFSGITAPAQSHATVHSCIRTCFHWLSYMGYMCYMFIYREFSRVLKRQLSDFIYIFSRERNHDSEFSH